MSLTINANLEVQQKSSGTQKKDTAGKKEVFESKIQGAQDETNIKKKPDTKGWTKETVTIKEGDSLDKIAYRYGLDPDDFVDQLKKEGKLPQDYKRNERHAHDISWMKPGKSVNVQYPKSEALKEKYQDFKDKRTIDNANRKAIAKAQQEQAQKAADAKKPQEPEKTWWDKFFGD